MKELNSYVIREAVYDDVYRGLLECLDELSPTVLEEKDAIRILKIREDVNVKTVVFVYEGEVVGTASYFLEPKLFHGGNVACHIEDVATKKDFQKCGVASKIIKHIIDSVEDFSYKIILNCKEELIPFYEKIGFHKHEQQMRFDYVKKSS